VDGDDAAGGRGVELAVAAAAFGVGLGALGRGLVEFAGDAAELEVEAALGEGGVHGLLDAADADAGDGPSRWTICTDIGLAGRRIVAPLIGPAKRDAGGRRRGGARR
jgi:hypothetical protein